MLLNRSHNIVEAPLAIKRDAVVKFFEVFIGCFDLFGCDAVSFMQFVEHLDSLFFRNLFVPKRSRSFLFALFALVWVGLWVFLLVDLQIGFVKSRPRLVLILRFRSFDLLFAFLAVCSHLILVIINQQTILAAINKRTIIRLNWSFLIKIEVFAYALFKGLMISFNSDKTLSDSVLITGVIPISISSSSLLVPPWSRQARVLWASLIRGSSILLS